MSCSRHFRRAHAHNCARFARFSTRPSSDPLLTQHTRVQVDVDRVEDEFWAKLNLAETAKEAANQVKIPAVYAFSRGTDGKVRPQKYSGPQTTVEFVKGIQSLLISLLHAP